MGMRLGNKDEESKKKAFGLEDGLILILKHNTSVSVTDGFNTFTVLLSQQKGTNRKHAIFPFPFPYPQLSLLIPCPVGTKSKHRKARDQRVIVSE
jgi:hypothetical protein